MVRDLQLLPGATATSLSPRQHWASLQGLRL